MMKSQSHLFATIASVVGLLAAAFIIIVCTTSTSSTSTHAFLAPLPSKTNNNNNNNNNIVMNKRNNNNNNNNNNNVQRHPSILLLDQRSSSSSISSLYSSSNNDNETENNNNNNNDDTEEAPTAATFTQPTRETELGRMSQGIARTGMKDIGELRVGDVVVAKYEVPKLDIWIDAGYEIIELYSQGVNSETGLVEKIPLQSLEDTIDKVGYTRYLKVYSPKYHDDAGPVIVTPEEMGLVTLKAELVEAMWLAVPGLFWVFLCATFASNYNAKYGGNFLDAFFRT